MLRRQRTTVNMADLMAVVERFRSGRPHSNVAETRYRLELITRHDEPDAEGRWRSYSLSSAATQCPIVHTSTKNHQEA